MASKTLLARPWTSHRLDQAMLAVVAGNFLLALVIGLQRDQLELALQAGSPLLALSVPEVEAHCHEPTLSQVGTLTNAGLLDIGSWSAPLRR